MEKYRIKPEYQYKKELITLSTDREAINLMGADVRVKRPKRRKKPATEEVIRGATQKDLENLYNAAKGIHPFIEKVNVPDTSTSNTVEKSDPKKAADTKK